MDREAWYSVTPEIIACHIAERCACGLIIDAFCGVGGNAIQFAFTCERFIAIDIDAQKIRMAQHNAKIYGVADRIEFIVCDFMTIAPSLKAEVDFLSPPWGGPGYLNSEQFDLNSMPLNGYKIYSAARKITGNIAYYLPRNVDTDQLKILMGPGSDCEVEQHLMNNKLKASTVFFGDLVAEEE